MCKPWKINGAGGSNRYESKFKPSELRRLQKGRDDDGEHERMEK
jgi:hypothetical protein